MKVSRNGIREIRPGDHDPTDSLLKRSSRTLKHDVPFAEDPACSLLPRNGTRRRAVGVNKHHVARVGLRAECQDINFTFSGRGAPHSTDDELTELIELGAIGEIAGWSYNQHGILLEGGINPRVASVPLEQPAQRLVVGVAAGVKKAEAIRAALRGRLVTGLITDEATAQILLDQSV